MPDCQHFVRRLSSRGGRNLAETWVLGFSGRLFPMVPREWREQNDLRIELAAMSQQESYAFLKSLLDFFQHRATRSTQLPRLWWRPPAASRPSCGV